MLPARQFAALRSCKLGNREKAGLLGQVDPAFFVTEGDAIEVFRKPVKGGGIRGNG